MKRLLLSLPVVFGFIACSQVKLLPSKQNQAPELSSIDQGAELAKVNNMTIREGYIELLGRLNPRVKAQMSNPATKKQLLNNLVEQELMYQESVRRGLDQRADVKEKAALYQRVIVAQSLLEDEVDKKAREYYEQHKNDEFTKVKISQIQMSFKKPEDEKKDEIQADGKPKPAATAPAAADPKQEALAKIQQARQRVTGGEDFAKVAEEISEDKISKRKGGDMGAIGRNDKRMERLGLEKLVVAAFALKNGEISEPIETEKGYHIIKVTSEPELVPFEDAKKVIQFQIQKQVRDDMLKELKEKGKVVYTEAASEPAAPAADPAAEQPAAPAPEGAMPVQPAPEGAAPAPAPAPEAATPPSSGVVTDSPAPTAAPQPAPQAPKDISPVVPKPKMAAPPPAPAHTDSGAPKPGNEQAAPAPDATPPGAPGTPPNPAPTAPTAPGSPTPVETHP